MRLTNAIRLGLAVTLAMAAGCASDSASRREVATTVSTPAAPTARLVVPPPASMSTAPASVQSSQPAAAPSSPVYEVTPATNVEFAGPHTADVAIAFQQAPAPGPTSRGPADAPPEVLPPAPAEPNGEVFPIDLSTALALADADNPQIAFAREQIREAYARLESAQVLWLPTISAGANFNKHEGSLQDTLGQVNNISRGAVYSGFGSGAVGAGSPMFPGLWMNFQLTDAIYQPLAARQTTRARGNAAAAMANDQLLQVAVAYLEVQRAVMEEAIAIEQMRNSQDLVDVTAAFASSGRGLVADADRAAAELELRRNDVVRAREGIAVTSARLAQLLRLDPTLLLQPIEPTVAPIELVPLGQPVGDLVAQGLTRRPELAQARALVDEAVYRYRREKCAPLLPSVWMGMSYGGFGGGQGSVITNYDNRMDFDAMAYWQLRNLGHGEVAARRTTRSLVTQAEIRQVAVMDQVAREVVEEHARVEARRQQIDVAMRGVTMAVDSHQRNVERIHGGVGLPIEVLQSIQALGQARRDYLRATIDYDIAQFSLCRAIGWQVSPGEVMSVANEAPNDMPTNANAGG